MRLLLVIFILLAPPIIAQAEFPRFEGDAVVVVPEVKIYASEESILDVSRMPRAQTAEFRNPNSYMLFRTVKFVDGRNVLFEARIWERCWGSSFVSNYQIIEIMKDGKCMSSSKVGDDPMMEDVWGAVDWGFDHHRDNKCFYIYVLCRHRHRRAQAIYTYRINQDFSVSECGVVFPKDELSKETKERQQSDDQFNKKRKKTKAQQDGAPNNPQRGSLDESKP